MQPNAMPAYLQPQWFFPLFVVGWFVASGMGALLSGWRSLSERFSAPAEVAGERFRFVSGSMGWVPWFPISYSNCLFLTVGEAGMALSLFLLFRFLSPPLFIPWAQVESVEKKSGLFGRRVVLQFKDSAVRLTLSGEVASRVVAAHAKAHANRKR